MLGLLPGLLLPGGWALRICLCEGLFGSHREAPSSCCEAPEPESSCCTSCPCSAQATSGAPAGPAAGKHERCGCIFLEAPEQPPCKLPSGGPVLGAVIALPPAPEPPAVRPLARATAARELAGLLPEPPGKRRNLPLLI